jgi:enoyl-CoA hydratase/carnithine racemase
MAVSWSPDARRDRNPQTTNQGELHDPNQRPSTTSSKTCIATITLNCSERLHALTFDIYAELRDLFVAQADEKTVRVVIIAMVGRGHCKGGDVESIIGELLKCDRRELLGFTRMTGALIRNLRAVPVAVIATLRGGRCLSRDRARG